MSAIKLSSSRISSLCAGLWLADAQLAATRNGKRSESCPTGVCVCVCVSACVPAPTCCWRRCITGVASASPSSLQLTLLCQHHLRKKTEKTGETEKRREQNRKSNESNKWSTKHFRPRCSCQSQLNRADEKIWPLKSNGSRVIRIISSVEATRKTHRRGQPTHRKQPHIMSARHRDDTHQGNISINKSNNRHLTLIRSNKSIMHTNTNTTTTTINTNTTCKRRRLIEHQKQLKLTNEMSESSILKPTGGCLAHLRLACAMSAPSRPRRSLSARKNSSKWPEQKVSVILNVSDNRRGKFSKSCASAVAAAACRSFPAT